MASLRSQPTIINSAPLSFSQRMYQHLQKALNTTQEVILQMAWGSLTGVPIYLDETCVEIIYLYVSESMAEENEEELCRRTAWLVQLQDICALSYSSEGWSKERLDQLLQQSHRRLPQND